MSCYDDGALRAYLDDALPGGQPAAIAAHTIECAACGQRLERQRALSAQVGALLAAPADIPDPRHALARLRAMPDGRQAPAPPAEPQRISRFSLPFLRRTPMRTSTSTWPGPRRGLLAGMAALLALLALLALPPVRAAADQLLQVFRVQKVMFMPISPERIAQLKQLNFDGNTLFVDKPRLVNQPAEPRAVDSAAAAASAAGSALVEPVVFPSAPTATEYVVHDRAIMQFKVNVESARQLLALLGIDDITLPDSLGAQPITADVPAFVETRYRGGDYSLTLYQGRSPTLTLPDGVDLAQLGQAGLRLLGMDQDAAAALSRRIDWSTTFIFPFPQDIRDIREVQVGDAQGLLVGEGRGASRHWQLYWQSGDRFAMLEGQGSIDDAEMLAAAESVR